MILTFIDNSDDAGKIAMKNAVLAKFFTRKSSQIRNVMSIFSTQEMVAKTLIRSAGGEKIFALRIIDHGRFYSDRLAPNTTALSICLKVLES